MPTYLQFEIHAASRRRAPGILAGPVAGFRGAATISFAVAAIFTRFKTAPLDRTKLAYSHSTPKRLALLVALVPVAPKIERIRYECDRVSDVTEESLGSAHQASLNMEK